MINETLQVQQYLNGENINKETLYRTCFLLVKWFREQNISNKMEIRNNIFAWASKHKVFIDFNLNGCIDSAFNDNSRLTTDTIIKISQNDINDIRSRFDDKNTKKIALAVLCYAKAFSDSNSEFSLSCTSLGCWTNIHYTNVSRRYINELIDYGYISLVEQGNTKSVWGNKARTKMNRYKINVSIRNAGEYILKDNDIDSLYREIFLK